MTATIASRPDTRQRRRRGASSSGSTADGGSSLAKSSPTTSTRFDSSSSSCSSPSPASPRCIRPAARSATPPARRPTCRRSSSTCSPWLPTGCRRSTNSSPSSAHCSGIAFGFDAVNGERSQRTLPRLVAQPIHRDEVINGKFVAGLGAIALALASVMAVVVSYGMLRLGIGPTTGEVVRMVAFFVVAVVYIALWLALAMAVVGVDTPRRHRCTGGHRRMVGVHVVRRLDRRTGRRHRASRAAPRQPPRPCWPTPGSNRTSGASRHRSCTRRRPGSC